jgi:membrane-bound lytic murein transglycosylase D
VPAAPQAEPAHTRLYTVRKGDTLVTIADRFGVSLNELRRWNKIPGVKVTPGERLRVAEPASAPHSAAHSTHSGSPAHTQAKGAAVSTQSASTHKESAAVGAPKHSGASTDKTPAHHSTAAAGAHKSGVAGANHARARKHVAHPH